jgi:Ca2+:H+ antiporter
MLNHDDITALSAHDESGRSGFHPWTFLVICWKSSSRMSMMTNSLWPFTIAALVLHFGDIDNQLWIFIAAYIGMVPAANLVGFAGHQLARKLPTTFGVLVETAMGSCVELVLLTVLIQQPGKMPIRVIRAVILGSILANLLLCLGLCFFVGGIFYPNQSFHVAISEVACNLMLVAGMGLVIPSIFYNSLRLSSNHSNEFLEESALRLSRVVAVVLLLAFLAYLWFQTQSHFGIYQDILQADESTDQRGQLKPAAKLTLTEALVAVAIGVAFVSFMAVFLVQQIEVRKEKHCIALAAAANTDDFFES